MRTGKGNDNNDRNDNKSTKAEIKWTEREQEKKVKWLFEQEERAWRLSAWGPQFLQSGALKEKETD